MDKNKLAKLRGNLKDCDVLFIDEISMISCLSFYLICAYLTVTFGDPLVSFGGKHVIVAGDFGQLPPPGAGHLALYNDNVGSWSDSLSAKKSAALLKSLATFRSEFPTTA